MLGASERRVSARTLVKRIVSGRMLLRGVSMYCCLEGTDGCLLVGCSRNVRSAAPHWLNALRRKKIKMKVRKSKEDKLRESNRKDLLKWLNQAY